MSCCPASPRSTSVRLAGPDRLSATDWYFGCATKSGSAGLASAAGASPTRPSGCGTCRSRSANLRVVASISGGGLRRRDASCVLRRSGTVDRGVPPRRYARLVATRRERRRRGMWSRRPASIRSIACPSTTGALSSCRPGRREVGRWLLLVRRRRLPAVGATRIKLSGRGAVSGLGRDGGWPYGSKRLGFGRHSRGVEICRDLAKAGAKSRPPLVALRQSVSRSGPVRP